eukprot:scaffold10069_cov69-Cylindrotheca_fusiformis.AAC.5
MEAPSARVEVEDEESDDESDFDDDTSSMSDWESQSLDWEQLLISIELELLIAPEINREWAKWMKECTPRAICVITSLGNDREMLSKLLSRGMPPFLEY